MPTPAPHRPAAFRKPRLLIVGCGDIGERVLRQLGGRYRVFALTSQPARRPALRSLGATPLLGDLDVPATLGRLAALAPRVLHLAPPPGKGRNDPRTAALLHALARGGVAERIVYGSTSGVYGDARGARIDETCATAPSTDRARRRVQAEQRLRWYGRAFGATVTLLRIPGIYAADRPGGAPRERVARGTPLLRAEDDVYTNHIHADDLARACIAALHRGRAQRVVHVSDDTELKMGDYFDLVADLAGLPRAARLPASEMREQSTPMGWSFMSESRRLDNRRLERELRVVLRYPTVREGLADG
ncbi:MAG: SDR family oxidoreductase [Methylibium sp.]|uniref:SDR family oxidoreductase n=1 Tax=Methylibium sp. TaxID=2067992 RepID=UPI001811F1FF|nr:SDR family oxidoreductase [Methylibium sp.]MBA3599130.1 SDR family oxidoreductase [Methylibium sp.]